MSYESINMFDKITCDKCGHKQTEICAEAGKKFFEAGWSFNRDARKYKHLCGGCNGKNSPVELWKVIEPRLLAHPLIKSVIRAES